MKKAVLIIISVVLLAFTAESQEMDCSKVKTGTFKTILDSGQEKFVTTIYRKKNKQIEENVAQGIKMEFVVTWTSECTYELSKPKLLKGVVPNISDDQIVYVKITDVTKEFYSVEVTSNFSTEKASFDYSILK